MIPHRSESGRGAAFSAAFVAKIELIIPRRSGDPRRWLGVELAHGSMLDRADVAKLEEEPAPLEPQAVEADARESRGSSQLSQHFFSLSQQIEAFILESPTASRTISRPCAAPPLAGATLPDSDDRTLSCEDAGTILKILEVISSRPHGLLWEYDMKSWRSSSAISSQPSQGPPWKYSLGIVISVDTRLIVGTGATSESARWNIG